jgi:DNA-binding protein H-NS
MPRGRKRTVESMRNEMETLKKQIETRERGEKLGQLTGSKEFRVVAKEINRLGLSEDEVNDLFQRQKEVVKRRKTTKRKGVKLKPKYRNPENPEQLWTGRGNRPRWVTAALERGLTLQDMLIEAE